MSAFTLSADNFKVALFISIKERLNALSILIYPSLIEAIRAESGSSFLG